MILNYASSILLGIKQCPYFALFCLSHHRSGGNRAGDANIAVAMARVAILAVGMAGPLCSPLWGVLPSCLGHTPPSCQGSVCDCPALTGHRGANGLGQTSGGAERGEVERAGTGSSAWRMGSLSLRWVDMDFTTRPKQQLQAPATSEALLGRTP